MSEPKFKVGDKVKTKELRGAEWFAVSKVIKTKEGEFYYKGVGRKIYSEDELESQGEK